MNKCKTGGKPNGYKNNRWYYADLGGSTRSLGVRQKCCLFGSLWEISLLQEPIVIFFSSKNLPVLQIFAMKSNMSSSGWPQHACPVCKWMRSVPGLTARSNPRLSLPFQSSNREKKLAKERRLYDSWGVYFRAMLTTNTFSIININTFGEHHLFPVGS